MREDLQRKIQEKIREAKLGRRGIQQENSRLFYDAEDRALEELYEIEFQTKTEIELFVTKVWNAWKKRTGSWAEIPRVHISPSGTHYYNANSNQIFIILENGTPFIVLHEIAHAIQFRETKKLGQSAHNKRPHIHDQRFLEILCDLVKEHISPDFAGRLHDECSKLF